MHFFKLSIIQCLSDVVLGIGLTMIGSALSSSKTVSYSVSSEVSFSSGSFSTATTVLESTATGFERIGSISTPSKEGSVYSSDTIVTGN